MSVHLPINPPPDHIGAANVVLGGSSRLYHVDEFEGSLSIKTVAAGSAVWLAGGRRFAVNEHCWLVLNDRQHYTLDIQSHEKTTTFCLFFERGFVEDVRQTVATPATRLLDDFDRDAPAVGFFEALEPEESPVLKKVRKFQRAISNGEITTQEWHDWFVDIGAALVAKQHATLAGAAKLPALKASTRMELCKRVLRGRDLLLASRNGSLPLKRLAREACLSPYHFHRTFRQLFGRTPHEFLIDYRLKRAAESLRKTAKSITEVCLENGFESLPSFSALFRKRFGIYPREFRRANGRIAEIRKIE